MRLGVFFSRLAVSLFASSLSACVVLADDKPLWEVGIGAAGLVFPAYRGSEEYRNFVLPMPYLVYRGQWIKSDKDGVRGVFFDSDRAEINLSLAASPPVSSKDVDIREHMPDLKPSVELGPSLDIKLWQSAGQDSRLKLLLPLRGAFTLERDSRFIGWQFSPRLNLDIDSPPGLPGWTLGLVGGPVFGDRRQHEYFYGVAPRYAEAGRPAYEARGGYAGMQFLSALWKRYPAYWVGAFVRYDNLHGAVFDDSPLVTQKSGFAGGVAVSWVFGESKTRVAAP